jgi:hypothetical protein
MMPAATHSPCQTRALFDGILDSNNAFIVIVSLVFRRYYDDDLATTDDGVVERPIFASSFYSFLNVWEHLGGDPTGASDGDGTGWFIGECPPHSLSLLIL